ncbi:acyl-CoA thioesterase [Nautilia sp.]
MKPYVYEVKITVSQGDIDFNGHVNNLKYLEWMINTAVEHSESLGFNPDTYRKIGSTWFVKSHYIEYKSPAFEGDELIVKTWIDEVGKITSKRKYEIYKNAKLLAYGITEWIFIDIKTGRPKRIPEEIINRYFIK